MKVLFLNLPLFDDVLSYHRQVMLHEKVDKIVACGLIGSSCETNASGNKLICLHCVRKANSFAEKSNTKIEFLKSNTKDVLLRSNNGYKDIVKNYLLSLYRTDKYNGNRRTKKYSYRLEDYCNSLEAKFNKYLKDNHLSRLYFFNSRFPSGAAARRSSTSNKIDYLTYDLMAKRRISIAYNSSVLDPDTLRKNVENELKSISNQTILDFSEKYMHLKLSNQFVAFEVFTRNQEFGLLPEGLGGEFIAIFTSSEDEYQYFGSDLGFPIMDQFEEIKSLTDNLKSSISIVVRIHPNQSGSEFEKKIKANLERDNGQLFIVDGSSKVNTYAVMKSSNINVTFGSLTAIESTLLKCRAVIIGRSIYDRSVKLPQFNSMKDLLNDENLMTGKLEVTESEILQAAKWVGFISGQFADAKLLQAKLGDFLPHNSVKWWVMDKFWRIVRLTNYPIPVMLERLSNLYKRINQ